MDTSGTKPQQPFMPMRDGAGSFSLDDPDDGTPIKEMFSLKDRLLLITEKCTYEVTLADQIDPDRTNPKLPHNVRRKIHNYGVGSEALCKILLQSKALFKEHCLPIDIAAAQKYALDALKEFEALDQAATAFKELENAAMDAAERNNKQPRSIALPSIGNLEPHCKSFSQKAHHFNKALLSVVRLFLPDATNWDDFQEIVRAKFGADGNFSKLLTEAVPNLKLVLNLRDAIEHQNNKAVTMRDFAMEPDGLIAPPTIQLNFRKSVLERTSISHLMESLVMGLPIYFEMITVHLSACFAQPVFGVRTFVDLLPDDFQKARHVRFGYCIWAGDQKLPFV